VRASFEESAQRLGLERVTTLYLHDPDSQPDIGAQLDSGLAGLSRLRDEGLVDHIGVGSMSTDALALAADHEATDELMVAGRHTLIDHTAAERVLPACAEHGVRVVAAAVFNSGLLATATPGRLFDYHAAPEHVVRRAERIAAVCREHDTDLPTAALHYPLRHPSVVRVVIGAQTPAQVRENAERIQRPPSLDLWEALESEHLIPAGALA
jgi:D-threo-aldose 1-dehydrogenase